MIRGLIIGIAVGLVDAALVQFGSGRNVAIAHIPHGIWLAIPLVWAAFCGTLGALFSIRVLRRVGKPILALSGPGLLFLMRAGPVLKRVLHLSVLSATSMCVLIGIFVVMISFALPDKIRLTPRRAAIVMGGFVGVVITAAVTCRPGGASVPNGFTHGQRHSVALIFLDTVRYDDLQSMPKLRNFAQASVSFENAWAPASWTLPSHFAILTGVDPWHGNYDARAQRFDFSGPTLAQMFANRGYSTAGVFANPILNPSTGLTRGLQQLRYSMSSPGCRSALGSLLFHIYLYTGWNGGVCGYMPAQQITSYASNLSSSSHQPYFVTVNYIDGHDPYWLDTACTNGPLRIYKWSDWLHFARSVDEGVTIPAGAIARIRAQHQAAVTCMDRSLGSLLEKLTTGSQGTRTIVAVVADHGEQFGEHGLVTHRNSLYTQLLRVPMIVRIPGETPRRVTQPVSTSDLYGILLRAALSPLPRPGDPFRWTSRPVLARLPGVASSAADAQYHLIRWDDGREQLYNYRVDPQETVPLSTAGREDVLRRLRPQVLRLFADDGKDEAFRGLGYLQ